MRNATVFPAHIIYRGESALLVTIHDITEQKERARMIKALNEELQNRLCVLLADRGKLLQVFHNLLSNAEKFSREGGSVCVTARRDSSWRLNVEGLNLQPETLNSQPGGNFIEISAADTGIGMKTPVQTGIM